MSEFLWHFKVSITESLISSFIFLKAPVCYKTFNSSLFATDEKTSADGRTDYWILFSIGLAAGTLGALIDLSALYLKE
jgi:hypothetical protein